MYSELHKKYNWDEIFHGDSIKKQRPFKPIVEGISYDDFKDKMFAFMNWNNLINGNPE